jgi:hypothetical protein
MPVVPAVACRRAALSLAVVSLVPLGLAPPLGAQNREEFYRRHASFTVGASFGDGGTAPALTAGLGFRLAARVGLEFELAHARKLDFELDLCPPPRVCILGGRRPVTGRMVSLLPQLVFELLPGSRRVRAYARAGMGTAHVRQRYFSASPFSASLAGPVEFTRSSLTAALCYGGGVMVQVSSRLAVGADLRSLHVFDEPADPDRFITPAGTLRTVRVGSRVSWQF